MGPPIFSCFAGHPGLKHKGSQSTEVEEQMFNVKLSNVNRHLLNDFVRVLLVPLFFGDRRAQSASAPEESVMVPCKD